ncbi:hypothetical protein EU803_15415 [Loktanella sp. IMCC34160]|uniref:hypothetical protein n=1 Tax=Loktanella sp. IMCC34160 TaxID=2510646 RepID=UPI00101D0E7D|nr:hypothetical protein [Loktanella sp. IMCC34160]RYG90004.1 hypothetical protein EU803_15415 [Loktanella sp. IMCC34160]
MHRGEVRKAFCRSEIDIRPHRNIGQFGKQWNLEALLQRTRSRARQELVNLGPQRLAIAAMRLHKTGHR